MIKLNTMDKQEAKQWAELFNDLAEGNVIEYYSVDNGWQKVVNFIGAVQSHAIVTCYRIKPQPKTRRMTCQELSDWLRDCPQEHRVWKLAGSDIVHAVSDYDEDDANEEVASDIFVSRNHGEWEEPLIEVEE